MTYKRQLERRLCELDPSFKAAEKEGEKLFKQIIELLIEGDFNITEAEAGRFADKVRVLYQRMWLGKNATHGE
jgi:hypothetical protein